MSRVLSRPLIEMGSASRAALPYTAQAFLVVDWDKFYFFLERLFGIIVLEEV